MSAFTVRRSLRQALGYSGRFFAVPAVLAWLAKRRRKTIEAAVSGRFHSLTAGLVIAVFSEFRRSAVREHGRWLLSDWIPRKGFVMSSRVSASWRSAFGRGFRPNELGFLMAWLVAGAIGFPPDVACGATITVGGLITVAADDGASFKAGDQFAYSFTFDDQAVDTAAETFNARFNAGVSAFSLTRGGANVGTWDPSTGTFSVAPVKNFIAGANSDEVTIQATGSGFPAINGQPFFDVGLTFSFAGVQNFVDTGSGQTFAQVVGVSPLDFATASSTFAEIRDSNFGSPALTMTVVPEPPTYAIALAGLACGAYLVKKRRKPA